MKMKLPRHLHLSSIIILLHLQRCKPTRAASASPPSPTHKKPTLDPPLLKELRPTRDLNPLCSSVSVAYSFGTR